MKRKIETKAGRAALAGRVKVDPPTRLDRLLDRFEALLRARRNPESSWPRTVRRARQLVLAATLLYCLGLITMLTLLEVVGERRGALSLLLFLPPAGWLVPALVLLLLHWLLDVRGGWLHGMAALLVLVGYMNLRWSAWPAASGPSLTVMTCNIGGRSPPLGTAFAQREQPDLVVMQETRGVPLHVRQQHPDWHVARVDELLVVSRFPILRSGTVAGVTRNGLLLAAWFELDWSGRTIVLYNVHLPTPRSSFLGLRGRGFLAELAGAGGIYSRESWHEYRVYWQQRAELARALQAALARETRPFLVVGDFNLPDHGPMYRGFARQWTDAFAVRGRGYGFTFPADTGTPLTLFGPWLRLDYIFASRHWRPLRCVVEPRTRAQHLAVVARLELPPQP